MNSETLVIAAQIINEYSVARSQALQKRHAATSMFLERYTTRYSLEISKTISAGSEIASKFEDIVNELKEHNRLTSRNFNVIGLFSPGETMHSYLIAYLLDPLEEHGQGSLFLNIFLDKLGIENPNKGKNWVVTAETGRIDILLKRTHPHSVVVIENKSNFAVDQPNQLYRYWYQEIYTPLKNQPGGTEKILNPPPQSYRIVYLSPEHWKRPSTQSLQKPDGWDEALPPAVPMIPEEHQFRYFIVDWLKACLDSLPQENRRMKEFVTQYMEYWS
jgi:hypothetical protein